MATSARESENDLDRNRPSSSSALAADHFTYRQHSDVALASYLGRASDPLLMLFLDSPMIDRPKLSL